MVRWLAISALMVLSACAEGVSGGGEPSTRSGVEGRVLAGPTCPVEIEASPCPARPVQTTVRVLAASPGNAAVTTFRTEEDGTFRVPLDPGVYLLVPAIEDTGALFAKPTNVTVPAEGYVRVDVFLDTGIRAPG
jgi:hypothetical protein